MMVIVSKAVFAKEAPTAKLGTVLPMKIYRSASKYLERLDQHSRLFLVTVRPPNDVLWLVAVLTGLKFDGTKWQATRNSHPVTNISPLKGKLKFESGKGITAAKGALGMSLQTPRVLSAADVELLLKATGGPTVKPVRPPGPVQLAAHDDKSPLPCLCAKCLPSAPETIAAHGGTYFRAQAAAQGRLLWFWVPTELKDRLPAVVESVAGRMAKSLKPLSQANGQKKRADSDD